MPELRINPIESVMTHPAPSSGLTSELPASRTSEWDWAKAAIILISLSFGMRLFFLGYGELIPEEAYYWQFARRLDFSYLDHPPAIAWIIFLGTSLLGHNEFGVRIGAFLCSVGTAWFLYKLALTLFDRFRATGAVLLYSLLPYFFLNGFLATPDAPLLLCWSAYLFFLVRALRDNSRSAWMLLGAAMGLGMISKYTMALNGLATLVLMLLHRPARRWFLSPYPYLSALTALCFFTPVLYWNYVHDWISFGFQTSRRLQEPNEFSLHVLLLHLLVIITPLGLWALVARLRRPLSTTNQDQGFASMFFRVFTAVPLGVFVLFSLQHEPKPNWTGPGLLLALIWIAASLRGPLAKGWRATLVLLVVLYSSALTYLCLGIPGLPYSSKSQRYVGWANLGKQIGEVRRQLTELEGEAPVVVGMDKHFVTSQLAFYVPDIDESRPLAPGTVLGRSIFGMDALMWELWDQPPRADSTLLLVARGRSDLEKPELTAWVQRLSPIEEIKTVTRGSGSGVYYYRIAHGYHSPQGVDLSR